MKFRDNLLRLRGARNMTQEQLAMLLGVSRQAVSKWESGQAYPEMEKLDRMCGIFGCTMDELVRGEAPLRADAAVDAPSVPVDAPVTDICGYDRHMGRRALLIAGGAASIVLGAAGFVGTGGWGGPLSGGDAAPIELLTSPYQVYFLFAGLAVSIALFSFARTGHAGFMRDHPYVGDFYAAEQRERVGRLVASSRIAAVVIVGAGIALLMIQAGPLQHLSGGMASLLASIAAALAVLMYASLMARRLDVGSYNERASRACPGGCEAGDVLSAPPAESSREARAAYAEAWHRERDRVDRGRRVLVIVIAALTAILALIALATGMHWSAALQVAVWGGVSGAALWFVLPSLIE